MSAVKDGGPAFPCDDMVMRDNEGRLHGAPICSPGMSLRDRIALEALGGMLAHQRRYKPRPGSSGNWHEAISEEAYQIADAMLKAREASDV